MSIWTDKRGRRHVGIMVGGRRIHRVLPEGASARDAKQAEAELRASVARAAKPVIPGDPPLSAILGLYIEHTATLRSPETARYHAMRLGPWANQYKASQARQCAAHLIQDMVPHYAPATINRSLGALKKALTLAWERGITPDNYGLLIKRMPEHNERQIYLDVEDVRRLTDCASEAVAAAIWLALLTGCRRGELLKMRPEDIKENTITIHAGNTKTLHTRTVPIIAPMRHWLRYIPLPLTAEGLKSGFRRARVKAGLPEIHFHDLRHSCASILLANGADMLTISRILGHTSIKTTERYTHLQVDAQRRAMDAAFAEITPEITPGQRIRKNGST